MLLKSSANYFTSLTIFAINQGGSFSCFEALKTASCSQTFYISLVNSSMCSSIQKQLVSTIVLQIEAVAISLPSWHPLIWPFLSCLNNKEQKAI